MTLLAQSAFLRALGWALLHSLWQMGVLWLLYTLITANGKRFRSRQRYNLALGFVSLGTFFFIATLCNQLISGNNNLLTGSLTQFVETLYTTSGLINWLEPALPVLSAAYLIVIGFLFIRFTRQYYFSHQLINSGWKKVDPELRLFLQKVASQLSIKQKVRIGISDIVNTPLTVGFWKPVILLPVAVINHLSIQQTEAIILHELNHIKQNDYLVNLMIACLDIILFFNPFSRMMTGILLKERENSCDDMVLQFEYPACEYAQALLVLEKNRFHTTPLLAVSATGSSKKILLGRIHRILHGKPAPASFNYKMLAFFLTASLIAFAGLVRKKSLTLAETVIRQSIDPRTSSREVERQFVTPVNNDNIAAASAVNMEPVIYSADAVSNEVAEHLKKDIYYRIVALTEEKAAARADQEAAAVVEPAELISFASAEAPVLMDHSLIESTIAATASPDVEIPETVPYVPSSSFSYQYQYSQDTSFPKRKLLTATELKAKEDLEKALRALEEIDWKSLEKELGDQKIDIAKMQAELRKALEEVDWKRMNEELKSTYRSAENQAKIKQLYLQQLNEQQMAARKEAARKEMKSKQETIIMDRILQNEQLQKCTEENKKAQADKARVKKIVVI